MLGLFKRKPERRGFADAILSAFEGAAAGQAASAASTAAIEAVSGLLARSIAGARVQGPSWASAALSPCWLQTAVREMVRRGEHLSAMGFDRDGNLRLLPSGNWWWKGGLAEDDWRAVVTTYGPMDSVTRDMGRDELVFLQWSRLADQPHLGRSPHRLASLAGKAAAEVERSLGDEAGGPIASILTVPEGRDADGDELAGLRSDISKARGRALLLETVAGGDGDKANAPQRDWLATRLGPNMPGPLVELARDTFDRLVAAAGASPALFNDADGTAQREALRRWHLSTVLPVAKMIETELTARLEANVRLHFDNYALDLQARATALQKLIDSGMERTEALSIVGLLMEE